MSAFDEPVKNPTWMADIRFFFTPDDIDHMGKRGIDLATYDGVKANAIRIMGATEPPDASMPPDPSAKWSQARSTTFKNWIVNGYPFGTAVPQGAFLMANLAAARLRKDASTLSQAEIETLKAAFVGVMGLAVDNPASYFCQAGIHWLPGKLPGPTFYCLHHESRYNPWHRRYLLSFENALRSIPGCGNVTLPYWDITRPIPDFLYQPPFDKYTLPRDIGPNFPAGYVTRRYTPAQVMDNVNNLYRIPGQITVAMGKSLWSQFNTLIIGAHDNGHVSTGETMGQQDVAAYDPIFWFFHANLDRLWWRWQQALKATNLIGFLTTVKGSTDWLKTTPFNTLPPFSETADQTIDLGAAPDGADYQHPAGEKPFIFGAEAFGSLAAAALTGIHSSGRASVRVKGIDRLNIPGSFVVHLKAEGRTIASQAFFQARNPRSCSACIKQGKVDLDLDVDIDQLRGVPLSVVIQPMWPDAIGTTFPLSSAGNPTLNIRLLLQ